MKRRELLKLTALATGAAVCSPLAGSILSGCTTAPLETSAAYEPVFFTSNEFNFLQNFVDTILPKTDTPAATEVGVHRTIDSIVAKVYSPEDQKLYKTDFTVVQQLLEENGWENMKHDEKIQWLQKLELDMEGKGRSGYLHLKQQAIAFYLSSELIAENELNYLPVPGEYKPCISLEETGGKAWAI
jgi:hypothetical protein